MKIKVELPPRYKELDAAVEWLVTYVVSSFNMAAFALKPAFVQKVLKPIYVVVPQPEPILGAYRLLDLPQPVPKPGTLFSLKQAAAKVVSWTLSSKKEEWATIAEEVGLFDGYMVVHAQAPIPALVTPTWMRQVQQHLKSLKDYSSPHKEEYVSFDPDWQREIVALPKPVKVKTVLNVKT